MKKIYIIIAICFVGFFNIGASFEIDAVKNACLHNNVGINHLRETDYYAAIKEFEIAIRLNPNTQATAVYYNNLGKTYLTIGYAKMAQPCFERAIIQNPINFDYYLNLVCAFKSQGLLTSKLKEYKLKKSNPLNEIVVGLIYIEKGQAATGITVLDNFCNKEPDLLITKAVQYYVKNNVKRSK